MKNVYILWGGPTRFITDARGKGMQKDEQGMSHH